MVFLVAPDAAPPAPGPPALYVAAQHTWMAPDGSEWDLSHGLSGLRLMKGTRGMLLPTHQRFSRKSPGRAGSSYAGHVLNEREVLWPLKVFEHSGSAAWIAHNDRFWQTMDPERSGVWVVTQPGSEDQPAVKRWLRVRFEELVDDAVDDDLGLVPWVTYGIRLVADEDPLWRGEKMVRTFSAPAAGNYYGGDAGNGFGPPFYISPGSSAASASITNAGDESVSPTLTVRGPSTSATVGVSGHLVTFPMVLLDGQSRRINTDAGDQVLYDENGTDVTYQLGKIDFAQIPKGTDVPLTVGIVGTGSVTVEITPGYRMAKGPA